MQISDKWINSFPVKVKHLMVNTCMMHLCRLCACLWGRRKSSATQAFRTTTEVFGKLGQVSAGIRRGENKITTSFGIFTSILETIIPVSNCCKISVISPAPRQPCRGFWVGLQTGARLISSGGGGGLISSIKNELITNKLRLKKSIQDAFPI